MTASRVLHSPDGASIEILRWKVRTGSKVTVGTVLLLFKKNGDAEIHKLRSECVGTVSKIFQQAGQSIEPKQKLLQLDEGCSHPIVMKDMCAQCGKDLREDANSGTDSTAAPATTQESKRVFKRAKRANISMVHSVPELMVSDKHAEEIGRQDIERLRSRKKLVLLVDLDQTLIHTTTDDIPNKLKGVKHFQIAGVWYHTMFRPGTKEFLDNIVKYYELHIVTYGVRIYAHTIASMLDAEGKHFSHRILSRDELIDINTKKANLRSLFPCGDDMVAIIDDREDVWNYSPNIIPVLPYKFFTGTGDINAPNKVLNPSADVQAESTEGDSAKSVDDKTNQESSLQKAVENQEIEDNASEKVEIVKDNNSENDDNITKDDRGDKSTAPQSSDLPVTKKTKDSFPEETQLSGDDVKLSGDDVKLSGDDVKLSGDDVKLSGDDVKLSGDDVKLSGDDVKLSGDDVKLSGDDVKLSGDDVKLSGDDVKLSGDDVKLSGDDVKLSGDDVKLVEADGAQGNDSDKLVTNETIGKDRETVEGSEDKLSNGKTRDGKLESDKPVEEEEVVWPDNDTYLKNLEKILISLHEGFYSQTADETTSVSQVIGTLRHEVLEGCTLAFSGLFPQSISLRESTAYEIATKLGAQISDSVSDEVTHLVTSRLGTKKVRQASQFDNCTIVHPDWLWLSWYNIHRENEIKHLLTLENEIPEPSKNNGGLMMCGKYDPSFGRKRRPPMSNAGSSAKRSAEFDKDNEPSTSSGETDKSPEKKQRFSDSFNPLMSIDSDDFKDMQGEIDDEMSGSSDSEGEAGQTASSSAKLRRKVCTSNENTSSESSSSESLSNDYPKGWGPAKKRLGPGGTTPPDEHLTEQHEEEYIAMQDRIELGMPMEYDSDQSSDGDDEMAAALDEAMFEGD